MAEEKGFYFPQHEGGTRWLATPEALQSIRSITSTILFSVSVADVVVRRMPGLAARLGKHAAKP